MHKLVEEFVSIQGEGTHAGAKSYFIRFFGCNLSCSFCDEPLHTQKDKIYEKTTEDLVEAYKEAKCLNVVISGGEPTLNDLNDLITALQRVGAYVQIETNGYNLKNVSEANWVTLSPKEHKRDEDNIAKSSAVDEVKIPYPCNNDLIVFYVEHFKKAYLTPINDGSEINQENTRLALEKVMSFNGGLLLNTQLHKIWGVE